MECNHPFVLFLASGNPTEYAPRDNPRVRMYRFVNHAFLAACSSDRLLVNPSNTERGDGAILRSSCVLCKFTTSVFC